jgi:UDP-N-acetyl-D-galactosamine dehydrogenase
MVDKTSNFNPRICVIGLGYVGLPLARLFSTKYRTVGFDLSQSRVDELMSGRDSTLEVADDLLRSAIEMGKHNTDKGLVCTTDIEEIRNCNFYIVAVPTPVDENRNPVLSPLIGASETVGKVISKGDIVVYESTVYPGVTEDECIPVVEKVSGLEYNSDFFAGYSPERINPGDKEHTVEKILKVTSGSTPEIGKIVDEVYASVITAGTHLAPSIRVAEAAKVIENSQRDINIAFVNELAKIFNRMNIDTQDVLEAAGTKWNFLPFKPGLVGGHCIGVDPYYLAQAAQRTGYNPEIILAGRRVNDGMGEYVADQVVKLMLKKGIQVLNSKVLILGFTFKENCPDMLEVGNGNLSYDENIAHFSLWCILAAPLMLGNNVKNMTDEVLDIITNVEVIAVNQDPLGRQGRKVKDEGDSEVWSKELHDGSRAVLLFNRSENEKEIHFLWSEVGLPQYLNFNVRDLWERKEKGKFSDSYKAIVPKHGVVMVKIY